MKVSANFRNPLTRLIRFDEQPVVQTPLAALAPPLYERFRTARTRDQGLERSQSARGFGNVRDNHHDACGEAPWALP